MSIWPRRLGGRTALVLLATIGCAQVAGLAVHALAQPVAEHWSWPGPRVLIAFPAITAVATFVTFLAIRRLTAPIGGFAEAAERLARDVDSPLLPQTGPAELVMAAGALNLLATRIRRFVQDRSFMLAALGHDLRTPITRLKLKAEFIEDENLRDRMLADLAEVEELIRASLLFGAEGIADEPLTRLDLAGLVRTVLDETADSRPESAANLAYQGPDYLPVRARSRALKRALANLILNALAYGRGARVTLSAPVAGPGGRYVTLLVEDDGPGIPPAELDRMFEPFRRGEISRNRETGGSGLGLPIARDILRAHGGDITLANRAAGGVRAQVTLPV